MQASDRSLRSVFVGNIPYDATEEKLRDIFSAVGPVLSFRIVFDRETGKPKGYGFCEYKDQETATSAIRNLNGHDLGGRQLRVDSASNERARDEPEIPNVNSNEGGPIGHVAQHNLQHQAPPIPEPLVDAQTLINSLLCGLQPEMLFEVCKQLKTSLLINPNETRQMLMQNPQLSYAVLQSLVMIKAIDAQTAMNTLHKQLMQPAPLQTTMPALLAPLGPGMPNAGPMGPQQPQGPNPLVMQPQVISPFAFVGPNPMAGAPAPNQAPPPQQAPPPMAVNMAPVVNPAPAAAPADPRLARQHHANNINPAHFHMQQ